MRRHSSKFRHNQKLFPVLATLYEDRPSNTRPDRVSPVFTGRSHEVHVRPHLQPSLQGLDDGQDGQSGAVSRGGTDPQPSSRVAATLQRRPLLPCPCGLPATQSEILRIFQGSSQSGPDFEFEYRTKATVLQHWVHSPQKLTESLFRKLMNFYFSLLFFPFHFLFRLSML